MWLQAPGVEGGWEVSAPGCKWPALSSLAGEETGLLHSCHPLRECSGTSQEFGGTWPGQQVVCLALFPFFSCGHFADLNNGLRVPGTTRSLDLGGWFYRMSRLSAQDLQEGSRVMDDPWNLGAVLLCGIQPPGGVHRPRQPCDMYVPVWVHTPLPP